MYFSRENLQEKITIYFIYFIQFFMKYLLFEKLVDTFCTKTHAKKAPFFLGEFSGIVHYLRGLWIKIGNFVKNIFAHFSGKLRNFVRGLFCQNFHNFS